MMNCEELINNLIADFNNITHPYPAEQIDALERRAKMYIRRIFKSESHYLDDIHRAFHPSVSSMPRQSTPEEREQRRIERWESRRNRVLNVLTTMLEECKMKSEKIAEEVQEYNAANYARRVFVVHGHDPEIKESVARVLEKLKFEPVILHEQPNRGRTIIEKFVDYSDVGFAVVLLSPDDLAYPEKASRIETKYRARQNVILELGFFLGKLGRERVMVLYHEHNDFEIPSDYAGVLYIPYDPYGRWRFALSDELKAAGYDVDLNLLSSHA